MQEHFLRFSTLCSAHSSPELVKKYSKCTQKICKSICWDVRRHVLRTVAQNLSKTIPNAPRKYARVFCWYFRRYVLRTVAQSLSKSMYPKCTQKICKSICWDVRRYVLRAVVQNLSKSIPNAPRKYARAFFRCSALCYAHCSPELVEHYLKCTHKICNIIFLYVRCCVLRTVAQNISKSIPNAPRTYARIFLF